MATWRNDEIEEQSACYAPSRLTGVWGYIWKGLVAIVVVCVLVWVWSEFFYTATTNCDLCGATYRSGRGYTLRIEGGTSPLFSVGKATEKAIGAIGDTGNGGDDNSGASPEPKVEPTCYDLCQDCKDRVCAAIVEMRQ